MNRLQLQKLLREHNVRDDSYTLDTAGGAGDILVMYWNGRDWSVYYSERGLRRSEVRHQTEESACADLFDRLLSDPTVRQDPGGP